MELTSAAFFFSKMVMDELEEIYLFIMIAKIMLCNTSSFSWLKKGTKIWQVSQRFNSMVTVSALPPPPFCWGAQPSVPNFEKWGRWEKMSAWGVLKSSCHRYLPGGLTMFLGKKDFVKWNMVLRAKFSNVNLGLC